MPTLLKFAGRILLLTACLTAAGCASTESDMPWNAPQPWEGSPAIPGLSPGMDQ